MNPWGIHSIGDIYHPGVKAGTSDGRWVVAVAEPYTAGSLRAAWWVLTGKAFALRWPRAGDLEVALNVEPQPRPRLDTKDQKCI